MNESKTHQNPGQDLRRLFTSLASTQPQTVYLRDGDLVLYRRSRSLLYQCRYRLADGLGIAEQLARPVLNTPLRPRVICMTSPDTDNGWVWRTKHILLHRLRPIAVLTCCNR